MFSSLSYKVWMFLLSTTMLYATSHVPLLSHSVILHGPLTEQLILTVPHTSLWLVSIVVDKIP